MVTASQPNKESAEYGHYVVTAHKSGAVTASTCCSFLKPFARNLILAKSCRLEVYSVDEVDSKSLKLEMVIATRGKVLTLNSYRPSDSSYNVDWLFYTTEKQRYAAISYDQLSSKGNDDVSAEYVVTEFAGVWGNVTGREKDFPPLVIINPEANLIVLSFYEGFLKVLQLNYHGKLNEEFTVLLEVASLVDMCFLRNNFIVVLHQDSIRKRRHITQYKINTGNQSLTNFEKELSLKNTEYSRVLPVFAHHGVVLISEQEVSFYNGSSHKVLPMESKIVTAVGRIPSEDGVDKWVVGDGNGRLWVVWLEKAESNNSTTSSSSNATVKGLAMEYLGRTCIPSSLDYIDEGLLYCGSLFGDSMFLQLLEEPNESKEYLQVLEEHTNLGSIVDFCHVQGVAGVSTVVTCSGFAQDGSIRVVRNGIGMEEIADIPLPGLVRVFRLKSTSADYLLQSFVSATRVLQIIGDELKECEIPSFDLVSSTLYAGENDFGLVQVTSSCVNFYSGNGGEEGSSYVPKKTTSVMDMDDEEEDEDFDMVGLGSDSITVANGNARGQLVIVGGKELTYLQINEAGVEEVSKCNLDEEVSCVDVSPFGLSSGSDKAKYCTVGLWNDFSVLVLDLSNNLQQISKISLGNVDSGARSLLSCSLQGEELLFVGLGDGTLLHYTWDNCEKGELCAIGRKKACLGSQAISLSTFIAKNGNTCVFAASDRPTVAYKSSNGKIMYSNLNTSSIHSACVFPSSADDIDGNTCLALASEDSLIIGTLDDIQKLHVQTWKLNETPRRIEYWRAASCFVIGCMGLEQMNSGSFPEGTGYEPHRVRFLDDSTFKELHTIDLEPFEEILSFSCCQVECESNSNTSTKRCMAIGTAYVYPGEDEPTKGRILIFECANQNNDNLASMAPMRSFRQICEEQVTGAVFSMAMFKETYLIVTISSRVKLFKLSERDGVTSLTSVASHHGHILSVVVKCCDDYAVVGDLMRSLSVMKFSTEEGLEEVARDYNTNWTTAVEMISKNIYMGAENWNNLFCLRRNNEATSSEARCRLDTTGQYYLGEMVNKFVEGSLVTPSDSATDVSQVVTGSQTLFGTSQGSIGTIVGLDKATYSFFAALEKALLRVTPDVGNVTHSDFRAFEADSRKRPTIGFIDGDLVESMLDMKKDDMQKVADQMNKDALWDIHNENEMVLGEDQDKRRVLTVEDILARLEELSRRH